MLYPGGAWDSANGLMGWPSRTQRDRAARSSAYTGTPTSERPRRTVCTDQPCTWQPCTGQCRGRHEPPHARAMSPRQPIHLSFVDPHSSVSTLSAVPLDGTRALQLEQLEQLEHCSAAPLVCARGSRGLSRHKCAGDRLHEQCALEMRNAARCLQAT